MERIMGRFPTIPEYYQQEIDRSVDLNTTPKQCCPFHREDTPSFSYSAEKHRWRCFGSCKCGGDVIALHQKHYRLQTREEAEKSLSYLYGIQVNKIQTTPEEVELLVDDVKVEFEIVYAKACMMANSVTRWLELDYVMSRYPVVVRDLQQLVDKWEVNNGIH